MRGVLDALYGACIQLMQALHKDYSGDSCMTMTLASVTDCRKTPYEYDINQVV